ncbi:MAG: radical SAM protein [Nitrospinota bacterium]
MLLDKFNRAIRELSIEPSAVDFFNAQNGKSNVVKSLLHTDDLVRFVKALAFIGVNHVSLEDKEPFARDDIFYLLRAIARTKEIKTISLTTNGHYLSQNIDKIKKLQLNKVQVVLPTVNKTIYNQLSSSDIFDKVIDGILKSKSSKINVSILSYIESNLNSNEIEPLIEFAVDNKIDISFEELIKKDNVPSVLPRYKEIISKLQLTPIGENSFKDKSSNITISFETVQTLKCQLCTKIWVTNNGKVELCKKVGDYSIDLEAFFSQDPTDGDLIDLATKIPLNKPLTVD